MKSYPFSNTTGGTIPAGAALVPAGIDANGLLLVGQPTADSSMFVVFNGPADVPAGATGVAFDWTAGDVPVGINPADAPYTAADTFGTKAGDWLIRKGKTGFRVVTDTIQGIANAMPDPVGAAAGGGSWLGDYALTSTSFCADNNTSFPRSANTYVFGAGYTLYDTLDATPLPTVSDTLRIKMPTIAAGGAQVVLMVCPRYSLYVGPLASRPSGFFLVQAKVGSFLTPTFQDLEAGAWSSSGPLLLTGSTAIEAAKPVAAAGTYVDVTVDYRVLFASSGAAWSGAAPLIRFGVCTAGLALWNTINATWGVGSTGRGFSPVPSCPSFVQIN